MCINVAVWDWTVFSLVNVVGDFWLVDSDENQSEAPKIQKGLPK